MKVLRVGIPCIALFSMIGCSSTGLGDKRVDYRSAAVQAPSLEVPPDLTAPVADDRYRVPQGESEGVATFSDYSKGGTTAERGRAGAAVLPEVKGVRMERSGAQRWLVVSDKPQNVWAVVKSFLQENGLGIESEDQAAGVIETNWAENRAKIPQDGVRKLIGKVFDGIYSSGERDQYRVRLERGRDGETTEVYLTHRRMEEVLDKEGTNPKWQARPADPEMEAIMLQRLMARFGGDASAGATAGGAATSAAASGAQARLEEIFDGSRIIVLNDTFDRAWRRAGLAIERAGLAVEDRDRDRGVYLLLPAREEKSWLGKLKFWESDEDSGKRYRVNVKDGGTVCEVSVTNQNGAHDDATRQILEAIYKNINE